MRTETFPDGATKKEWEQFRRWQDNFNTDIHGYIKDHDEGLTLKRFRSGGVRGHQAPICSDCDADLNNKTAQEVVDLALEKMKSDLGYAREWISNPYGYWHHNIGLGIQQEALEILDSQHDADS